MKWAVTTCKVIQVEEFYSTSRDTDASYTGHTAKQTNDDQERSTWLATS